MSRGRGEITTPQGLGWVDQQIDANENAIGAARLRFRDAELNPVFSLWREAVKIAERLSLALWRSWEERDSYRTAHERLAERLKTLEEVVRGQDREIGDLRAVLRDADITVTAPEPDPREVREVTLWVDGACAGQGNRRRSKWRAGGGIIRQVEGRTDEWSIPFGSVSSQEAELLAIREALNRVEDRPRSNVVIYTDSQYAIGVLARGLRAKAHIDLIAETKALMRECRTCRFEKVRGHSGNPLNERADRLATAATELSPIPGMLEEHHV